MRFIKLTTITEYVHSDFTKTIDEKDLGINVNHIGHFISDEKWTRLSTRNNCWFTVKESPEEILQLIKEGESENKSK